MDERNASRRYHDRVARRYDGIYDDPYWRFHDELTWRWIKPYIPREASAACLDLGCGTGKWGLRLLKSGFVTTFVDNSGAMIEQARKKVQGPRAHKATLICADVGDLAALPAGHFALALAMGDVLSICADAAAALGQVRRVMAPGGVFIATADNRLAATDHFAQRGNLDELEEFVATGKTQWLTAQRQEQFMLTTFTPAGLRRMFERGGWEVVEIKGKTILDVRRNPKLLEPADAEERLLKMEEELARDPGAIGRAAHLQVVARVAG